MDEAIAQENSIKDTSVEFTPCRLSDIVDELKEALERQPATKDKEEKKALRKKKKQVMELEGYRDKLIEYDNHLDTLGERNSYSCLLYTSCCMCHGEIIERCENNSR